MLFESPNTSTTTVLLTARLGQPGFLLLSWLVGAICVLLGAICYSELAVNFPNVRRRIRLSEPGVRCDMGVHQLMSLPDCRLLCPDRRRRSCFRELCHFLVTRYLAKA